MLTHFNLYRGLFLCLYLHCDCRGDKPAFYTSSYAADVIVLGFYNYKVVGSVGEYRYDPLPIQREGIMCIHCDTKLLNKEDCLGLNSIVSLGDCSAIQPFLESLGLKSMILEEFVKHEQLF